nr:PhnD/SsuA/transferrin family substrate-binding protein [Rhizobium sp. RHZ01]
MPGGELDPNSLWLHPGLLLAQACWGPIERGLADHIQIVGQPGYDGIEGGEGPLYSSAIIMRGGGANAMPPPLDGSAAIALNLLRGRRFFYNEVDSMSGILALASDLEGMGETLDIFSHREQCGSHRRSIKAVAEGAADLAAIHFKSFLCTYRTYSQVAGKPCIYGIIYLQRRACGNVRTPRGMRSVPPAVPPGAGSRMLAKIVHMEIKSEYPSAR